MASESTGGGRGPRSQAETESLEAQIETLKSDIASIGNTLAGMAKSQARGYARQGQAQADAALESAQAYSEALEERITKNPFSAVLVALGLGFLVGLMSRR